jgi:carbamoyltransferase
LHAKKPRAQSHGLDEMSGSYLGPAYTQDEIEQRLDVLGAKFDVLNDEDLINTTAKMLASGKAVGWHQGRMEFGPRALGGRSILADPRSPTIQKQLNLKVKYRESFRPFAPSILCEEANNWFEDYRDEVPYMSTVLKFKKNKKHLVPGVVHIDGTGRLQTGTKENNLLYYKLIKQFYKITKIPMILNTSFNENEPIVYTPDEALDCFLRTRMDVLVLKKFIIIR